MTRILIVEDETALAEPLSYLLELEGYETAHADDGNAAVQLFEQEGADLILLDLMLPGRSGTEVCRHIRQTSTVPIIMVTAKDSEVDTIVGLELGADDYVTKPYSSRELVARIRAVLRRRAADEEDDDSVVEIGRVRLDSDSHTVHVAGAEVAMPLREFELLEYLMRNERLVISRQKLLDEVWGYDPFSITNTIEVFVSNLRRKLEAGGEPRLLHTVRGAGYVLRV